MLRVDVSICSNFYLPPQKFSNISHFCSDIHISHSSKSLTFAIKTFLDSLLKQKKTIIRYADFKSLSSASLEISNIKSKLYTTGQKIKQEALSTSMKANSCKPGLAHLLSVCMALNDYGLAEVVCGSEELNRFKCPQTLNSTLLPTSTTSEVF